MNPVEQKTFVFLDKFIEELREVFKDEFLHLGGDEVDLKCWFVINLSQFVNF